MTSLAPVDAKLPVSGMLVIELVPWEKGGLHLFSFVGSGF